MLERVGGRHGRIEAGQCGGKEELIKKGFKLRQSLDVVRNRLTDVHVRHESRTDTQRYAQTRAHTHT